MPAAIEQEGQSMDREVRVPKTIETSYKPIVYLEDIYGQQQIDERARLPAPVMPQRRQPFTRQRQPFQIHGIPAMDSFVRRYVVPDANRELVPSSSRFQQLPSRTEGMVPRGLQLPFQDIPMPPTPRQAGVDGETQTVPAAIPLNPNATPFTPRTTQSSPWWSETDGRSAQDISGTPIAQPTFDDGAGPSTLPRDTEEEEISKRFKRYRFPYLTKNMTSADMRESAVNRVEKYEEQIIQYFMDANYNNRTSRPAIVSQLSQYLMVPGDVIDAYLDRVFDYESALP
jgi:hypothetical protein